MNLHLSHHNNFIVHFIINEEKYTNTENRYIVCADDLNVRLKSPKLEVVEPNVDSVFKKIGDLSRYKVIYIHYLNSLLIDFVNALTVDIKVVWIFWGNDGFEQIKNYNNDLCLEERSKDYYDQNLKPRMKWCKNPIYLYKNYKALKKLKQEPSPFYQNYLKATERIDFFAHYILEDYSLIKANSNLKAKYVDFNYMSNEQCFIGRKSITKEKEKKNIIIGNSANHSNNHLDLFEKIASYNLSNIEKIYTPLSYSGVQDYVDVVLKDGELKFREKFCPMTALVPLDEYYAILETISLAVFGTIRSQAAGNIISLLLQGTRVYLNPKNVLYSFFKERGVLLFDIDTDLKNHLDTNKIGWLSEEEKQANNEALNRICGEEAMQKKYNNLLTLCD